MTAAERPRGRRGLSPTLGDTCTPGLTVTRCWAEEAAAPTRGEKQQETSLEETQRLVVLPRVPPPSFWKLPKGLGSVHAPAEGDMEFRLRGGRPWGRRRVGARSVPADRVSVPKGLKPGWPLRLDLGVTGACLGLSLTVHVQPVEPWKPKHLRGAGGKTPLLCGCRTVRLCPACWLAGWLAGGLPSPRRLHVCFLPRGGHRRNLPGPDTLARTEGPVRPLPRALLAHGRHGRSLSCASASSEEPTHVPRPESIFFVSSSCRRKTLLGLGGRVGAQVCEPRSGHLLEG